MQACPGHLELFVEVMLGSYECMHALRKDEMTEICNECGESVAKGSGKFVNRVPDLNTTEERREMRKPHPEGTFMCAECDSKIREDKEIPEKTLVIKMKGSLKEINSFCERVGEVSNEYDLEVEF